MDEYIGVFWEFCENFIISHSKQNNDLYFPLIKLPNNVMEDIFQNDSFHSIP